MRFTFGLVSLCVFSTACATDDRSEDLTTNTAVQDIESENGISINGISINGISINGSSLNGISINGISINGISINGISINGISINGISINGTSLQGYVNSTWTAGLTDGSSLRLRIDSATTGTGANADVGMLGVSYETAAGWQPLCGTDDAGAPILAVSVPGTWNLQSGVPGGGAYTPSDSLMTFACRGKTVAKCVELGYKPWNGNADELASCVRLLRGDYCGDGTAYTHNGTLLNLFDAQGIQVDTESWPVEAEWTPNGARCIASEAATRFHRYDFSPTCLSNGALRSIPTCGTSFDAGASLISEVAPL